MNDTPRVPVEPTERLAQYVKGTSPYRAWRGVPPEGEPTLKSDIAAMLSAAPAPEGDYDLGKRDGYEQAVQDIDRLTGGDGEYVFATDGGGCPDAEAMKTRIVERFQAREDAQPVWVDGVPTKHQAKEWFIAETTFGDRVVLTALPEEYAYDFKTADETYIKADRIKRWMPFPDSQYRFPHPAPDALRVAVYDLIENAVAARGCGLKNDPDGIVSSALFDTIMNARQALAALQAEQGAK